VLTPSASTSTPEHMVSEPVAQLLVSSVRSVPSKVSASALNWIETPS
jgi:hypothetical protein